jgi:hypothetical protein
MGLHIKKCVCLIVLEFNHISNIIEDLDQNSEDWNLMENLLATEQHLNHMDLLNIDRVIILSKMAFKL